MSKILLYNNFINENFGELLYKNKPESYFPFIKVYDKDIALNIDTEEFKFIEIQNGSRLLLESDETPFVMMLPLSILTLPTDNITIDMNNKKYNPYRIDSIEIPKGVTPLGVIRNLNYTEFPVSFCETFKEKIKQQYPDYDVTFNNTLVYNAYDTIERYNIELDILINKEAKTIQCLMINSDTNARAI